MRDDEPGFFQTLPRFLYAARLSPTEAAKRFLEQRSTMSNIQEEIIPQGEYKVVLAHQEERHSEASGRDYISQVFVVIQGPYTGKILYSNLTDTEKTRWKYADAAPGIKQLLEGERIYLLDVDIVNYQGVDRNSGGKLKQMPGTPAPVMVRAYGTDYVRKDLAES